MSYNTRDNLREAKVAIAGFIKREVENDPVLYNAGDLTRLNGQYPSVEFQVEQVYFQIDINWDYVGTFRRFNIVHGVAKYTGHGVALSCRVSQGGSAKTAFKAERAAELSQRFYALVAKIWAYIEAMPFIAMISEQEQPDPKLVELNEPKVGGYITGPIEVEAKDTGGWRKAIGVSKITAPATIIKVNRVRIVAEYEGKTVQFHKDSPIRFWA